MQRSTSSIRRLLLAAACLSWMAGCRDDKDDPAVANQDINEPIPPSDDLPNPEPEPDPDPAPQPTPTPDDLPDPEPEPDPEPAPQPSGWTGTIKDMVLTTVSAVDSDHVWTSSPGGVGLYATSDGGVTWSNIADSRSRLQFVDAQHGWALYGNDYIQSSSDGGETWTTRLSFGSYQATSISFIDPDTGWVGRGSKLYKTTDGGENWTEVDVEIWITDVKFVNSQVGWIVSNSGDVILKSEDGGDTWTESWSSESSVSLLDIATVGTTHAWVVGTSGVLATTDGGDTWEAYEGAGGTAVSFADEDHGWMVSYYKIRHTEDGGATWTDQAVPDGPWAQGTLGFHWSGFLDVVFVNATTGWVVGDNGVILRTTTGGKPPE